MLESVLTASGAIGPEKPRAAACFTGHRNVPLREVPLLRALIRQCVTEACNAGIRTFYCGAALGFDLLAGYEAVGLQQKFPDLRLVLVMPCAEQSRLWSPPDRERHAKLIQLVRSRYPEDVIVLSPFYFSGCMQIRNHYMVDRSQLCISYQYSVSGGTFSTVMYARKKGVPVINLYDCMHRGLSGAQSADSSFRESDIHGALYSYPLLSSKMPILRLCLLSGSFRHVGALCSNASFGSPKSLINVRRSLHCRNRLYRRRNSLPASAPADDTADTGTETVF